jgi:hybrid cluster-associated redox disulfide protein
LKGVEKMSKATKEMTFQELLEKFPQAAPIIAARGLHCLGCSGALFESIEQGSKMHGLTDKQIEEMLTEINNENKKKEPKAKK